MRKPVNYLLLTTLLFALAGCPPQQPLSEPNTTELAPEEPAPPPQEEPEPEKTPEPEKIPEPAQPPVEPNDHAPEPTKSEPEEPNEPNTPVIVKFHDKCAPLLSKFVIEAGAVKYSSLRRTGQIEKLLREFENLEPNEYESWPQNDKIALWINAYNIKMLDILCRNYPIESSKFDRIFWHPTSIRHIPPSNKTDSSKWDAYKLIVMNEQFTLQQIEQRFFIAQFNEPRIYFTLMQGGMSGPPLRNEPYYGQKLNQQLTDQIKMYLKRRNTFAIDRKNNHLYLPAILQRSWYGRFFSPKYATDKKFKDKRSDIRAVLNFLIEYLPSDDIDYLQTHSFTIRYINYDWRLNDASEKKN